MNYRLFHNDLITFMLLLVLFISSIHMSVACAKEVFNEPGELVEIDQNLVEKAVPVTDTIYHEVTTLKSKRYVIASSGLNIRKEPNENAIIIESVPYGSELSTKSTWEKVVNNEKVDDWTEVLAPDGAVGYVKSKYITDEPPMKYMGNYKITYYCPCARCCGWENGPTASGVMPTAGVTIAADKSVPFGTKLMIDGQTYIVQDRGGAIKGNRIDVFCKTHSEAINRGVHNSDVYLLP